MTHPIDTRPHTAPPQALYLRCPLHECGSGFPEETGLVAHLAEKHTALELVMAAVGTARAETERVSVARPAGEAA